MPLNHAEFQRREEKMERRMTARFSLAGGHAPRKISLKSFPEARIIRELSSATVFAGEFRTVYL
jgi:hypothetical protein